MPLFEVAILKRDEGKETLVYGPLAVLAKNAESAKIGAIQHQASQESLDPDHMEVLVRPFVSRVSAATSYLTFGAGDQQ